MKFDPGQNDSYWLCRSGSVACGSMPHRHDGTTVLYSASQPSSRYKFTLIWEDPTPSEGSHIVTWHMPTHDADAAIEGAVLTYADFVLPNRDACPAVFRLSTPLPFGSLITQHQPG